jgi:hypothetical protein
MAIEAATPPLALIEALLLSMHYVWAAYLWSDLDTTKYSAQSRSWLNQNVGLPSVKLEIFVKWTLASHTQLPALMGENTRRW